MAKISKLEVHNTFSGSIVLQYEDGRVIKYDETNKEFTDEMFDLIGIYYSEAMETLRKLYKKSISNPQYFRYRVVSRFLRCNMGGYDDKLDFDAEDRMNLEIVPCPLRKECEHEGIICQPKLKHPLSRQQYTIMGMIYNNIPIKDIAHRLSIAETTCKTHKQSAMKRLGCNSLQDFMHHARTNKLFGE